jgi:hypothetical protein
MIVYLICRTEVGSTKLLLFEKLHVIIIQVPMSISEKGALFIYHIFIQLQTQFFF